MGNQDASNGTPEIGFVSLGMFIIDEIYFPPPKPPVKNILGGAGAYSALGARIFSPPPLSKTVSWIVDCGSDFPIELRQAIAQWDTSCLLRETPERLTTRGWNGYGENEHRAFKYLTPKIRLDQHSLTKEMLRSKSFHLICSPSRCIELAKGTLTRRQEVGIDGASPLFIWEPVPDLCVPTELETCRKALKHIQAVSPNHMELASFFGASANRGEDVDREVVEKCAADWLSSGIGQHGSGVVVVRCGKDGCYIASRSLSRWLPAYHQAGTGKVVDPTGGGNGFLGGLAIALARGKDIVEAGVCGSVSASFAIEQVGMPILTQEEEGEYWNGEQAQDRVDKLLQRL
ncbi:gb [Venturia nashicola]|nr:gb [Venturia nashicola]